VPVAVTALVGTPLLWFCILKRDAVNAAQRRERANANTTVAAATGTRRTGSLRLRPSAPTLAETDFRATSGAFEIISRMLSLPFHQPAHVQQRHPH
jgi:hypothetical protein